MSTSSLITQDAGVESEGDSEELPHKLVKSQLDLFWSAEFADCTIRCKSLEWPVHRSILSHGCKWLKQALTGEFQEAKTNVLDMAEDDPHAVEGLLIYIHILEYPVWGVASKGDKHGIGEKSSNLRGKSTVPKAKWETHLSLFELADKICLQRLKIMAKKKLQSVMPTEWMQGTFSRLLQQLWDMQQVGVEDLKAIALNVVSTNAGDLMVKPQFRDLLSGDSSFNVDFINQLISGPKEPDTVLEKELVSIRKRSDRNRKALQEVVNGWGSRSFWANKTDVGNLLINWDKP